MVPPPDERADDLPDDAPPQVERTRIGLSASYLTPQPALPPPSPPRGDGAPTGTLPSAAAPLIAAEQLAVASPNPPPAHRGSGERAAVRIPPPAFVALKGAVLEHAPPRLVRVRYPIEDWLLNPYGAVQDGFVAAMLDNVVTMLAYALDPLRPTSTLELSVRYFRAIRAGHVTVDGAVLRAGRTTVTMECLVWDDASELCAKATATNLYVG